MDKIGPYVSEGLIRELKRCFPHVNPYPGHSLAEVMYLAGEQHVIIFLEEVLERHKEAILTANIAPTV